MRRSSDRRRLYPTLARWGIALIFLGIAGMAWLTLETASTDALARAGNARLDAAVRAASYEDRLRMTRQARGIILEELSLSPARPAAWARLAYAEALEQQRLSPQAAQTLLRTYERAPLDADLILWDPNRKWTISAKTHRMKVDYNAYEGIEVTGIPDTVLLRGKVVVRDQKHVGATTDGSFVRRESGTARSPDGLRL